MTVEYGVDLDEARRAWIVVHQGISAIQRRRAEVLGRQLRARQRVSADAAPDPHDDTTIPPIWFRSAKSPASRLELIAVTIAAVVAPVGWLGGWVLKRAVTQKIPGCLRAFPIAALLWSGVAIGVVLVAMYRPTLTTSSIVIAPWVCVQIAAVPAVAGIYGVLDGWLAVPGSDQWWPLTPRRRPITAAEAAAILGDYQIDRAARRGPRPALSLGESRLAR